MGLVFQAEDVALQRSVALKVMKPALAEDSSARSRFLREGRAAAALKSDHVVIIHQVGQEGDVPFLAMEYLEGEPLDRRLERERTLPVAEVLRIGRELAEGLAAAHARGLIHRDIKPANIWLEGTRGRVKILDFGLARAATVDVQLTGSGVVVGTPAYMAPEQARGRTLDARCDLFSLGCVLYRLATGQAPFSGDDLVALVAAVTLDDPLPPRTINPALPPALADLIQQLLAKRPDDRPPTARAVAERLERIARDPVAEMGKSPVAPALPAGEPIVRPVASSTTGARQVGTASFAPMPAGPARAPSDATETPSGPYVDKGLPAAPEGPSGASSVFRLDVARCLCAPLKRWKLALVGCLLSALVAFLVGEKFSAKTWKAEGSLEYTDPLLTVIEREIFPSPAIATLAHEKVVCSQRNLQILNEEFQLNVDPLILAQCFKVSRPENRATRPKNQDLPFITIVLEWENSDQAAALVQRLMELNIDQLAERRKSAFVKDITRRERNLKDQEGDLKAARDAVERYLADRRILDPQGEHESLTRVVTQRGVELTTKETLQASQEEQFKRLNERVAELSKARPKDREDEEFQRQKRDFQRAVDEAQTQLLEAQKQLEQLQKDLNVTSRLVKSGVRPVADKEKLERQTQIQKEKLGNLKKALDSRTADLAELKRKRDPSVSPALLRALEEKDKVEIELFATKAQVRQLRSTLEGLRQQLRKVDEVRSGWEPLAAAVKEKSDERKRLRDDLEKVRKLERRNANELDIYSRATTSPIMISNRGQVTAIWFAIPMLLWLGLIVVAEARATRKTHGPR
jgi:hypothetical protein